MNITGKVNKIKMATEGCPDDPPKWGPEMINGKESEVTTMKTERLSKRDEERKKRKADRERRRKRRRVRQAPPIAQFPSNDDPLSMFDRFKQPLNHSLRNLWAPSAGFLVCGGPSLEKLDLEKLRDRGVISLAINNVAGFAPVRAFLCADPPEKFHGGIFLDPAILKFVPTTKLGKRIRMRSPDGKLAFTTMRVQDCPSVFAFKRDSHWEPSAFLKRDAATWGISKEQAKSLERPHILFTFFIGLRMLHYLGCRHVYLLGVDFTMDSDHGYVFDQHRTAGAMRGNNNSYRIAAEMCSELQPHLNAAGFYVYNCNRHSYLTAFPHVPFHRALEHCRGVVPREPFALSDWYDKDGESDDRGEDD
jgi:hypothetical protein